MNKDTFFPALWVTFLWPSQLDCIVCCHLTPTCRLPNVHLSVCVTPVTVCLEKAHRPVTAQPDHNGLPLNQLTQSQGDHGGQRTTARTHNDRRPRAVSSQKPWCREHCKCSRVEVRLDAGLVMGLGKGFARTLRRLTGILYRFPKAMRRSGRLEVSLLWKSSGGSRSL